MSDGTTTVRVKVSPEAARIVGKQAPRDLQISAAKGALPLSGNDLVTVLFFFANSKDSELKSLALATVRELPTAVLGPVVSSAETHPHLLHFITRERYDTADVLELLLQNPALANETLVFCASRVHEPMLSMIANNAQRLAEAPQIVDAILKNPHADKALKFRFGWVDEEAPALIDEQESDEEQAEEQPQDEEAEPAGEIEEVEEEKLSKYQQALELGVAEKIKMAMTGDKEWRSIFLRDSNKLVSSAALKNPRITDGEVLALAKLKTTSDELIRIITLNKDWMKSYEMKKAIALHPRTPLNKAMRLMSVFNEKDLKAVAKSRELPAAIVNNAKRMMMAKEKKK
ncbi:MAG: hypothetical protein GWN87_20505 [Desulfuromonadales bacterium]|nr:hypothetical protein [Desulfuromonadales bacterium]NIS42389.1 hypothetical protein [Desulfuromonadales bacterium]